MEKLYYHYCSEDAFLSIITSKMLWLTQIVKSNDEEEVKRTLKYIWNSIKNDIKKGINVFADNKDSPIELINDTIKLNLEQLLSGDFVPYGVCLTYNRDLSQNWNEYGERGKGLALGFTNDLFYGIKHDFPSPNSFFSEAIGYHDVIYDTNRCNLKGQFKTICIEAINSNGQNALGWLNAFNTLKIYSAFIKNPTFIDEREIRIIFYPNSVSEDFQSNNNKSQIKNIENHPKLHCSLPWIKTNGTCALKEIIIGSNCKYSKKDIKTLLKANGINNEIIISKSEYPIRSSENH